MKPILNSFSSPFLWLRFSPQHQLCLQAGAGCQIAHGLPLAGEPQWTRMPQCVHCCRVCQHNAQVRLPARWDYTHRCKELPLQLGLITDHCVVLNCNQSPACKLHKVCAPCIFVLNCQQTGPLSIFKSDSNLDWMHNFRSVQNCAQSPSLTIGDVLCKTTQDLFGDIGFAQNHIHVQIANATLLHKNSYQL